MEGHSRKETNWLREFNSVDARCTVGAMLEVRSAAAMSGFDENEQLLRSLREQIDEFLLGYRGQVVLHFPNPGNAGDSLIATGTFHAFSRHDITPEIITLEDRVEGRVVFLGGGGNFVPFYQDIGAAVKKFHGRASQIILLPHTVRGHENLLKQLDGTCTFFLRDRPSYDYVRATNPNIQAILAHDMAFHLDVPLVMNEPSLRTRGEVLVRERLAEVGCSLDLIRSRSSVDFLRIDRESTAGSPTTDADVSMLFGLGVLPETAPQAAWCFLRAIEHAQRIVTDRLHVGIGAALLGVPCTLRDNSYGKNSAVYQNSLLSFPSVHFAAS